MEGFQYATCDRDMLLSQLVEHVMSERFCKAVTYEYELCLRHHEHLATPGYVFPEGASVNEQIEFQGLKRCEGYRQSSARCMQEWDRATAVVKRAVQSPLCKEARQRLAKCSEDAQVHPPMLAPTWDGKMLPVDKCQGEAKDVSICALTTMATKTFKKKMQQEQELRLRSLLTPSVSI